MADAVYTFFAVLATLIGGSGVILNFLVCLMYFATPKLLDATNIFMLNMAVGDFTYSIVALPLLVASNARGEWAFGEAGCTAYAFITFFFALGTMMLLAVAAYERYFTLCRLYNDGQTQFSKKRAILLCALIWCYSLFWSVMPVLGWSRYIPEGIGTSCSVDWTSKEQGNVWFTILLILGCFLLPVSIIICSYLKTFRALRKLSQQALQNWGENNRVTQETLKAESKMMWIIIAITAGFLFAWTPYALTAVVAIINPNRISPIGATIPAYMAKSSACYNPIIYVFMYRKMRSRLWAILCCKKSQVHPDAQIASEMASYQKSAAATYAGRGTSFNDQNADFPHSAWIAGGSWGEGGSEDFEVSRQNSLMIPR